MGLIHGYLPRTLEKVLYLLPMLYWIAGVAASTSGVLSEKEYREEVREMQQFHCLPCGNGCTGPFRSSDVH